MTRVPKQLRLPTVTAYILTGVLIGPYCLDLIPDAVISGMEFISDIALAFIAFGVGEFFRLSTLKKNGLRVMFITLSEALTASALVFPVSYTHLHRDRDRQIQRIDLVALRDHHALSLHARRGRRRKRRRARRAEALLAGLWQRADRASPGVCAHGPERDDPRCV